MGNGSASASDARPVALVTGGARGIGQAICRDLARDYHVALVYCQTSPDWAGPEFETLKADLTDPEAAGQAVRATVARFGRIDVIVHNAGVVSTSPLENFTPDSYRQMFDVNVFAAQGLLSAALPHLPRGGRMVVISSVNAVLPPRGAALYGASKAALETWTKGAAKEMGARGIRINAIAPGAIDVDDAPRDEDLRQAFIDLTAIGRLGCPEDIARAVRFLVSDAASFITGEVLTVSGGYRL